ncbi:chorismate--pyruvate lyase family protein [Ferrimonas senticii]|uniref:chorismate--pyruvate lyase family protein n=1 Tax=Ferrimonas senticii TaxID=394566 RepID=UPI0004235822|nr:chorismate lyase [Ferrimonas senticii]
MLVTELDLEVGPSAHFQRWLGDRDSLTEHLRRRCHHFEVELLRQWQQAATESTELWPAGERLWLREVLLHLDGRPWVYAVTEIPLTTLSHGGVDFTLLGTRPLGEVLFSHPQIRPCALTVRQFASDSRAAQLARQHRQPVHQPLWGRSRAFELAGMPLRVNEVFLPIAQQQLS